MVNCPICSQEISGCVCPGCGFDLSCDYEKYPTLTLLADKLDPISARKIARERRLRNLLRCPVCSGTAFAFALDSKQFECMQCHENQSVEWFNARIDVERIVRTDDAARTAKPPVPVRHSIAAGNDFISLLRQDGSVDIRGKSVFLPPSLRRWDNMVSIAAGGNMIAGLDRNNQVRYTRVGSRTGISSVQQWDDMIDIAVGPDHIVGLRSDGTVRAAGDRSFGQCDVSGWSNIAAVSAGSRHTVGLRCDGTVVMAGSGAGGRCDVSGWKRITAISAGALHTVGLCGDGTVVVAGQYYADQYKADDWKGITAISAGNYHTLGLRSDGTVVAAGSNVYGQCDVGRWRDIVEIYAGMFYSVGIRKDGTIVAAGDNRRGHCDIARLKR